MIPKFASFQMILIFAVAISEFVIAGQRVQKTTEQKITENQEQVLEYLSRNIRLSCGIYNFKAASSGKTEEEVKKLLTNKLFQETVPEVIDVIKNNPILIGRNGAFGPEWLQYIGDGNIFTKEVFISLRDKADETFDACIDFFGQPRKDREKYFISTVSQDYLGGPTTIGHAHRSDLSTCLSNHTLRSLAKQVGRLRTIPDTMLHEFIHQFTMGQLYTACDEGITDFTISYFLETFNVISDDTYLKGKQYRQWLINNYRSEKKDKINAFNNEPRRIRPNVYVFILATIPNAVGWEPIKRAFRSYNDENFVFSKKYSGDPQKVKAREFFDRVQFFTDKIFTGKNKKNIYEGIGVHIADELLKEYFDVEITELKAQPPTE